MEDNKTQPVEIFPGMTSEEISALYFDATALREPSYRLYQLNTEGHRYYYIFTENGPEFFPSVTTLLRQVTPTSPFLIEWMLENGKEGATEKRDLAAAYGTMMHGEFERLIISRQYDFDNASERVRAFMERENIPDKMFSEWCVKIRRDVLAFAQFVLDYKVVPLAIEIGLVSRVHRFAGCVDLPCVMTDPKTKQQFPAIIDFKSGRKGFYEDHELQLGLYREMWNENYPGLQIERIFNFSPKDWRKGPTYNLKEQTGSVNLRKIPHLLALAAIEDEKRENTITLVHGTFSLDRGNPADNVLSLSLAELIAKKSQPEAKPEDGPEGETLFSGEEAPNKGRKRKKTPADAISPAEPINPPAKERKPRKSKNSEK